MLPANVAQYYDRSRQTRAFGFRDPVNYPRLGAHVGLDYNRRITTVPALKAGRVTAVVWTPEMGRCVEVLSSDGVYLTYCHIANQALPHVGQWLNQGDRVGQIATGSGAYADRNHWNFRGTASTGPHMHLVASRIHRAAWNFPYGRKLSDYIDPDTIVRAVLAAPAGKGEPTPTPTKPQEEEPIIMATGVFYTDHKNDKDRKGAIVDTTSGLVSRFGWFSEAYAHGIAKAFGATQAAKITEGQLNALVRDVAAIKPAAPVADKK